MKRIEVRNSLLPLYCADMNGNCQQIFDLRAECEMAQGDAECMCGFAFYVVFPRDLAGDLQHSLTGISGDLLVKCPACGHKGFVVVNEIEEPGARALKELFVGVGK